MSWNYLANRILIVNDTADVGHPYAPLFQGLGDITHDIDAFMLNPYQFKLIQFTGGADISPSLYGDTSPKHMCSSNNTRDIQEVKLFNKAKQTGAKMMGICRGLQFLNVMAGGKMMHHITGHAMKDHWVGTPSPTFSTFMVNSYHHQMCIPARGSYIIAWGSEQLSSCYIGDKDEDMTWYGPEVEALFMPAARAVGVQWHPEALDKKHKGRIFYDNLIHDYLTMTSVTFRNLYLGEDYVHRTASV